MTNNTTTSSDMKRKPKCPFPIEGTVTPTEWGFIPNIHDELEYITKTPHGDMLKQAVERATERYGHGTEVRVCFTGSNGMCNNFHLLGPINKSSSEPQSVITQYEGVCDHCGVIEFDEKPVGKCPACKSDLRLIQEVNKNELCKKSTHATKLEHTRQKVESIYNGFTNSPYSMRSSLVMEKVSPESTTPDTETTNVQ